MNRDSRTAKSLRNSVVAMAMFVVTFVVQFFSRNVFLDRLGTEVLGLNSTAANLLQFLNLAELGVVTAVGSLLYKPMFEGDEERINDIVSFQGLIYRRVALFILVGGVILSFFFPWFFEKMRLPLWYAYASFGVLLFSSLLGYFFNYRQVLLLADQQDYRHILSYKSVFLVKVLVQMWAVSRFADGYVWWLILEGLFAVVATVSLDVTVRHTYPFLRETGKRLGELRRQYPEMERRVKQIFLHKLGSFVVSQSSPVIIYAFTTLSLVAYYGNYMIIVMAVTSLVTALFSSMGGAVGSLVAEGNKGRILSVFGELFSVRFLFIATFTFAMVIASPALISVWIGPEYVLPELTVALITVNMYLYVSRATVDNFLLAYGLYSDVYSPPVMVTLNLGLSILFGSLWGLNGILLGVDISLFAILFCWEPYYLFTRGLKTPYLRYVRLYARHLLLGLVAAVPAWLVYRLLPVHGANPWATLGMAVLPCLLYLLILAFLLTVTRSGLDRFLHRLRPATH